MTTLDPILVPYDGSPCSRVAVACARRIARENGARTVLLHVNSPFDLPSGGFLTVQLAAQALLDEEARRFESPVETRVIDGSAPETIASEAYRLGAALVIAGTRGRSVARGLLLGSVARYLLHTVRLPLLVVHEEPVRFERIVVGVDGGKNAPELVRQAKMLGEATGAALTLAHAVDADPDVVADPARFGIPDEVYRDALMAHGQRIFGPVRATAGPDVEECLLYGNAAQRLRAYAAESGADVVAIGRRGESGRDVAAWLSIAFALAVRGPFATLVV